MTNPTERKALSESGDKLERISRACVALLDYQQADEEGVMVLTSREAIHVLIDGIRSGHLLPSDRVREMEEENARLRYLINVLIENHPDDIVADGGCTVFDLWRKDARNALKGETDNG